MILPERINDLTELAAFLRTLPANDDESAEFGFDMESVFPDGRTAHPCGTAACIGGWVSHINHYDRVSIWVAVEALGVSHRNAYALCFPDKNNCQAAYGATPQQAARAVEILRDTDEVDWPCAMAEGAA